MQPTFAKRVYPSNDGAMRRSPIAWLPGRRHSVTVDPVMTTAVQRPAARLQLGILASLLGLAALAWLLRDARMLGMDAGPGADPGGLGFYVLSWVVMMSAMMFPSIAPMVLTFGFLQRRRR